MTNPACLIVIATIGLVIATFALVWKTGKLVSETRKQRTENKTPIISLELFPNRDDGWLMDLVLANVGRGTAFNVTFQIEVDEEDFKRCNVTPLRKSSKPLNFLLAGTSMNFCFGSFADLVQRKKRRDESVEVDPLKPFIVTVEYEDMDEKKYHAEHVIDIRTYDGLVRDSFSVAREQQKDICAIKDILKDWCGSDKNKRR